MAIELSLVKLRIHCEKKLLRESSYFDNECYEQLFETILRHLNNKFVISDMPIIYIPQESEIKLREKIIKLSQIAEKFYKENNHPKISNINHIKYLKMIHKILIFKKKLFILIHTTSNQNITNQLYHSQKTSSSSLLSSSLPSSNSISTNSLSNETHMKKRPRIEYHIELDYISSVTFGLKELYLSGITVSDIIKGIQDKLNIRTSTNIQVQCFYIINILYTVCIVCLK